MQPDTSLGSETALRITVNGKDMTSEARTLADLLVALDLATAKVATARNEEFVPQGKRADTKLEDGDRIEVVAPRQGG